MLRYISFNVKKITKQNLREKILGFLRNQKEEDRSAKSGVILNKLLKLPEFQKAQTVLFYMPFDGEVNTLDMIKKAKEMGKKIGLPRILRKVKEIIPVLTYCLDKELEMGPYGIQQPKDDSKMALKIEDLDMVVVPGVAFDGQNNRLGRGGGYYDRFLRKLPSQIPTIGLAFDFQLIERLPRQEHDVAVARVLVN